LIVPEQKNLKNGILSAQSRKHAMKINTTVRNLTDLMIILSVYVRRQVRIKADANAIR